MVVSDGVAEGVSENVAVDVEDSEGETEDVEVAEGVAVADLVNVGNTEGDSEGDAWATWAIATFCTTVFKDAIAPAA